MDAASSSFLNHAVLRYGVAYELSPDGSIKFRKGDLWVEFPEGTRLGEIEQQLQAQFGPTVVDVVEQNFANHPRSIGELRAGKTDMGKDWSPRDVLIDTLRLIDAGTIDVRYVVLTRIDNTGPDEHETIVVTNAPDVFVTAGVLAKASALVTNDD